MKAIPVHPAALWCGKNKPYAQMMAPTMAREMKVPGAPRINRGRRPTRSMRKRAGRVESVLTMP